MVGMFRKYWSWMSKPYERPAPLILINGLAEQFESWFCNRQYWNEHFDLKTPEILVYSGTQLRKRVDDGLPITVDYLTDQLEIYLDHFVQAEDYYLVASSLGGQIALEYAHRHPEKVKRMVLICPSGLGGEEKLPVVEGVRCHDYEALVASVFHNRKFVNPGLVRYYKRVFSDRAMRKVVLRTIRGTCEHSVRILLPEISTQTLVLFGQNDLIVDPVIAREACQGLPNFVYMALPRCGHAPQIERAWDVNRIVVDFLKQPSPSPVLSKPQAAPVSANLVPQPT
jgi:pimeloyl-ACP methyl ester carboxylesterase